jgi:hypothetical protein
LLGWEKYTTICYYYGMKIFRKILVVFSGIVLAALPGSLLAHGGVSNQSGNAVVFLIQQPL